MITFLPMYSRFLNCFKYEIRQNLRPVNFFLKQLGQIYICEYGFSKFSNFSQKEKNYGTSVKKFTGRFSGLIQRQFIIYHLRFSCWRLFYGQVIVWILKLPSKTAKLPSKVRIAVQTSWSNWNTGAIKWRPPSKLYYLEAAGC